MDVVLSALRARLPDASRLLAPACCAALLCASLVFDAEAQEPEPASPTGQTVYVHPEAVDAISRIRSPFCPGLMLEVCTSTAAATLRDSIQALAASGVPADSIVERVIATYGEEWRAVPRTDGAGIWAWLLPPFFLVVGVGLVGATLRARREDGTGRRTAEEAGPAELDRLRTALEELEATERPDW